LSVLTQAKLRLSDDFVSLDCERHPNHKLIYVCSFD
jgi:hypothetical protein